MISLTQKISQDHKYIYDKYSFLDDSIDEDHLACNFFLVNAGGKIKSELMSYNCNFFAPGDDFETLNDGSVIWAFVDDEDNFYLAILPIKSTQTLLDRFPREIIPLSKLDIFLAQKDEEAQKGRIEREKDLMKKMGIDEDEIKKRILESEKLARIQREKEIEEINKYDFNEYELNKNNNKKNNNVNNSKETENKTEDMVNQLSETSNKIIKNKKGEKISRDEDKTIAISNESNSKISGLKKITKKKEKIKGNKENIKESKEEEEINIDIESKNDKKESEKENKINENNKKNNAKEEVKKTEEKGKSEEDNNEEEEEEEDDDEDDKN